MGDRRDEAFELLSEIAGGAFAGAADVQFSGTMPLGLPVGAWGGAALVGLGLLGMGSSNVKYKKYAKHAADVGGGALAFEAGSAVVARMLKAKAAAPAATAGVAGFFGTPQQTVSQADLQAQLAQLAQMRRAA